ncbi:hypothetical protein [Serratia sp. AKBS12]|nr:hypothetical protein [Serratia sp. AKBS12]MCS3409435.1 hypothetical protein [Serratia sp. AKBS12]
MLLNLDALVGATVLTPARPKLCRTGVEAPHRSVSLAHIVKLM